MTILTVPGYLTLTWTSIGQTNAYNYARFISSGGTIQTGDYIEYDVFWVSAPAAAGTNYQLGLDMTFSSGAILRGSGQNDQNGLSPHPAAELPAIGQWYSRRISLSNYVGLGVTSVDLVSEGDAAGVYVARYRNIRLTNGGADRVSYYQDSTFDAPPTNPTFVQYLSAGTTLTSSTQTFATTPSISPAAALGTRSYGDGAPITPEPTRSASISHFGAWGSRSYGTGTNVSPGPVSAPIAMVSAGQAAATATVSVPRSISMLAAGGASSSVALSVAKSSGDIVLQPSTPQPSDITLDPKQGPNSLVTSSVGQSTATFGMGAKQKITDTAAGVSTATVTLGVRKPAALNNSNGVGGVSSNILQVILRASSFTIYPSNPPYGAKDVLLAPNAGPGEIQSMLVTSNGVATASFYLGTTQRITATSAGAASFTNNRIGLIFKIASTSAGVGGTRDQFGTSGTWYLGSSTRIAATSNGVGGARDQFGSSGKWYLGSSTRMAATSAGVGSMVTYLGSPARITSTSNGVGGARDQFGATGKWYLGSTTRISFTANGVGSFASNYTGSRLYMSITSAGRAAFAYNYLGSPFHITSTAAGVASVTYNYLGSPLRITSTSAGRAGSTFNYLSSRVYETATSNGRAGSTFYQSGSILLGNMTSRGVGHWEFGPLFISASAMNGVGHMNNVEVRGSQHISMVSNGIGSMRERFTKLSMASHGIAQLTFGLPPMEFIIYAGANYYRNGNWPTYHGQEAAHGVFAYLSSPVRAVFVSRGVATFTFPYEMRFVCYAGCRAFTSYIADDDPAIFPHANGRSATAGGVKAYQTGTTGMSGITDMTPVVGRPVTSAYLSSKVYHQILIRGISSMTFESRVPLFASHGVGGLQDNYISGVSHTTFDSNGVGTMYLEQPGFRPMSLASHGVSRNFAYQIGRVYFEAGIFRSNGRATAVLDTRTYAMVSNGVGQMNANLVKFGGMAWGRAYYYNPDFPVSEPILMPAGSNGIAHMTIEINGVPILRVVSHGVATMLSTLSGQIKNMSISIAAGSRPYYTFSGFHYGVEITAFQAHDAYFNGVGHMVNFATQISYMRATSRGIGRMSIRDNRVFFESRSETNLHRWTEHLSVEPYGPGYELRPTPIYSPDAWHMVAAFALAIRARGRSRMDMTTFMMTVYGNLLARYWSVQRPDLPNIDGDASNNPGHGQYWPRQRKLPYREVKTPYKYWYDYEYARR